jgi:3-methyladenine DNA glycosylase AlkD
MSRAVLQPFEEYQKSRVTFVQTVAELATRPQNIDALQSAGVMQLLRPLLLDNVPSIQQSAALALGRLANYSDDLAEAIVQNEILPQLVLSLANQNRFYKKAAAFVLRAVAKHSAELAQSVVDSGALDALVTCLEEFDPGVKEGAAWALGYIARHNSQLANCVVEAGAVPLLVLCVQEPELSLKRISASALSDIARHTAELAHKVYDAGAVTYLAQLIGHMDTQLKQQVCAALGQVAKHSVDLAEFVMEAELFPRILNCLKDTDMTVRKNAATCIREIAKQSPHLAKVIVNAGGSASIVDYISETTSNARLPGIMSLGYISAFDESLAMGVIVSKGVSPLRDALVNEPEDHIKAAAAWSLGQIGRHSADHARALAEVNVPSALLACYIDDKSSEDLRSKSKRALKSIVQMCEHLPALEPLLQTAPPNILKYVVHQFAKTLPNNVDARRTFVQSGGLEKIQQIRAEPGSKLREHIDEINSLYPPEIVRYFSPEYKDNLLKTLDDYGR